MTWPSPRTASLRRTSACTARTATSRWRGWRALLLALLLAFALGTSPAYTWFAAPAHLVLVLGVWALYAAVLRFLPRRRAVGVTLIGAGVPLTVLGALVAALGLERALTLWNDQMALLPWGLSCLLGITAYLGIPTNLPLIAAGCGLALVVTGALLTGRRRHAPA
ncbi:hypothetical protein [Actinomadura verrucosospora]|nr:hypothetical protein [Actinomadura verrucosospora]